MKNILLCFTLLYCCSCSSPTPECQLGQPTAIFHQDLPTVAQHHFQAQGQNGTESIQFTNGLHLEILQKGCEKISQEFRFTIPGKTSQQEAAYWIMQAAQSFHALANLSEQYLLYHQYAQVLEQNAKDLRLGEERGIGQGMKIQVDHIGGATQNIIRVLLSQ